MMHPGFCILKLTPHTSHLFLRATRGVSLGRNSKLLGDTFIWYEQKSKKTRQQRAVGVSLALFLTCSRVVTVGFWSDSMDWKRPSTTLEQLATVLTLHCNGI